MCIAGCNRIMTLACVERTVGSDTADILVERDLVEKIRKHRGITDTTGRHFDSSYLQCFFIDPNMYLTPTSRDIAAQDPAGQ